MPEYWVVNPDARNVSQWQGSADSCQVLSLTISWQPPGMPEPLVIDIDQLFEEALG